MTVPLYRGRFAPSPTGPLHFGSLVAAVGSYLQAKCQHGTWLLRFEDLDLPRNQDGAVDSILRCLEAHGLYWDETPLYQSQRLSLYQDALQQLEQQGQLFYCTCSRKQLQQTQIHTGIYPGSCRQRKQPPVARQYAIRIQVPDQTIHFVDAIMGEQSQQLAREVGDFVLYRADRIIAYQLAVVVDDHAQGISEVVRGADLLDNTARQIYLQRQLHYAQPNYCHLPVVNNARGEKLSKQTGASAVDNRAALANLGRVMVFLGQVDNLASIEPCATLAEFWQWAQSIWRLQTIPREGSPRFNLSST